VTRNESDFLGWPAVHLDNGPIRAVVVPDIGGRVLQFWLDEHPYLFVNPHLAGQLFTPEENWGDGTMASWKNYGGNKTWPAPQGWSGPDEWAGPPDPVLDSGRFRTLNVEDRRAVVQSQPDPRTGLQMTRELILAPDAARAVLRRTMRNVSDRAVRWSLWDVTQLECGDGRGAVRPHCRMSIPVNSVSRFEHGFSVLYGADDNLQWRTDDPSVFGVEYAGMLGKVGLDSQAGWVAFSDDQWTFLHQFEVDLAASYPDGGATVEVWTHGPGIAAGVDFGGEQLRGQFMEMEVLGPLVDLAPGEQASADLVWSACRCPGPIVDTTAVGCTAQRLEVVRHGPGAHVQGTFGVFTPGRAQLREIGSPRALLDVPAGPLAPLCLDQDIDSADGLLELVALDTSGAVTGRIAQVELRR
jgi:hypothetical protein